MARSQPTSAPADAARPVRRPWRSALVLVCRECDGVRDFGPKQVRKEIKARAKAELPPKAVRIATVSCLDVCPKRATCVVVAGAGERAVTVNGPAAARSVVDGIGAALAPATPAGADGPA